MVHFGFLDFLTIFNTRTYYLHHYYYSDYHISSEIIFFSEIKNI